MKLTISVFVGVTQGLKLTYLEGSSPHAQCNHHQPVCQCVCEYVTYWGGRSHIGFKITSYPPPTHPPTENFQLIGRLKHCPSQGNSDIVWVTPPPPCPQKFSTGTFSDWGIGGLRQVLSCLCMLPAADSLLESLVVYHPAGHAMKSTKIFGIIPVITLSNPKLWEIWSCDLVAILIFFPENGICSLCWSPCLATWKQLTGCPASLQFIWMVSWKVGCVWWLWDWWNCIIKCTECVDVMWNWSFWCCRGCIWRCYETQFLDVIWHPPPGPHVIWSGLEM